MLFENKRQLQRKKRKKQQQHQSLLPFFSLMTWTVVDFDNNLCLVSVPYLSFTFPKHGRHIREYTDTHSSRGGCTHPRRCCSQPVSPVHEMHPLLMGLLQISVKYKEVRGPNPSISSHHSAPKDKNRKEKRKKKKSSPLNINPARAPLVLNHYSLTLRPWWRWRGGALHPTVTLISLVICQTTRHRHESMLKLYK